MLLGPGVNIKRSPLCGRNFEYFSEDPLLAGELGAALVEGVQSQGVGTSLKHFAANNQETDRLRVSADVDERTLREIYLPAFERVVTAGPAVDGDVLLQQGQRHATPREHHWLLTEVLRDEWGFDGLVVSDWGAVHDRVAALAAGLDLEMPPQLGVQRRRGRRRGAGRRRSTRPCSTQAVARVLRAGRHALRRHGRAGRDAGRSTRTTPWPGAAARECAVLLKNDGGCCRCGPRAGQTVAVVGEFARTPRYQGAGSSQVNPTRVDVAARRAARRRARRGRGGVRPRLRHRHDDGDEALARRGRRVGRDARCRASRSSGCPPATSPRASTAPTWTCPPTSRAARARLAAVNDRVVVVLANGSAVLTVDWEDRTPRRCWSAGCPARPPAARSPTCCSAPPTRRAGSPRRSRCGWRTARRTSTSPATRGTCATARGSSSATAATTRLEPAGLLPVRPRAVLHVVRATPTSRSPSRAATPTATCGSTVDLHASPTPATARARRSRSSTSPTPRRRSRDRCASSRGSRKLALAPGSRGTATFDLDARDLSFWSETLRDWVLEAGEFELSVGASSRDLRLSGTIVRRRAARRARRSARCPRCRSGWPTRPARRRCARSSARADDGRLAGMLGSPELVTVVGNFPMSTLAGFPNVDLDHGTLDDLVARVDAARAS